MQLRLCFLVIALFTPISSPSSDPGQSGPMTFELKATSEATLNLPHDILLSSDQKKLYVADNGNHRIAVLDAMSLGMLTEFGKGELAEPHDLAWDNAGRLLVADTGNNRIAIYRIVDTGFHSAGEIRGRIRRPEGVAVHSDGRVFATGSVSGNLVVFRDGEVVAEAGGFSSPHDVEFDRNSGVWVADAGNDRLVQLDARLNIVRELGGDVYGFNGPRYLDFDASNRMVVADKYSNSIKVIDGEGNLIQVLGGKRGSGDESGLFYFPEGVEIQDCDFWFSDTYNNRIVRYRMSQ
ncbi:MAG: hypothetical protein GY703_23750 [Gammaproteobacteria bacterium]|nr:hypothetical protein [Gammaproteobacteria bacterium]